MMEYFHINKLRKPHDHQEKSEAPVLSEEDEAFLHRIASEGTPPPLPERPQDLPVAGETIGNNAQIALFNDAQNIPLPDVPDTPDENVSTEGEKSGKGKEKEKETTKHQRPFRWSFLRRDSRDGKRKKEVTATDLMSAAEGLKAADAKPNEDGNVSNHEAKKEEEEMTDVLENLNLAAVNNRVFSISTESQELLHKFTLVFKDLVNGVPTAYDDLESLLTNSENQIQRSYAHLPSFLKDIIEKLPTKMVASLGPEVLAAAAEKPSLQAAGTASKSSSKIKVPSLKDLVTKPGAVVGTLKAIMNFLKLRFPAFLGMNVLYSLALFILLFVFWYCHKRGREVRLEKERLLTESEIAALNNDDDPTLHPSSSPPYPQSSSPVPSHHNQNPQNPQPPPPAQTATTTTAPEGASIDEVRAGMYRDRDGGEANPAEAKYAEGGSLAKELREREGKNTS